MEDSLSLPFGFIVATVLFFLAAGVLWALARMFKARSNARQRKEEGASSVGFVIETFHDLVSQLKTKEEELERLRAVAEDRADSIQSTSEDVLRSVPGGVITLNLALEVLFVNPSAEAILGLGERGARWPGILDDLGADIAGAVRRALAGPADQRSRMEVGFHHPARGHLLLGMRVSDLRNHLNQTVGVVIVFNDLTGVRRLEEQVRLREKLSHLGEMSAGIAHELRNPMGVISGYADLLARQTPPEDPRFPSVKAIRDEIKGMNRVITEFLDFARPTAEPNRGTVDLRELFEGVVESRCATRPDVRVDLDVPAGMTILADELLLRQAFLNLVNNSLEAIPETGGAITIRAAARGNVCSMEIEDSGTGLPPGDVGKIFLPFHTTKDSGTGLGLAIVHKIVTCHGGTIEARSGKNGGALFRIEIPGVENRKTG